MENDEVTLSLKRVVGLLSPHFLQVLRNNAGVRRNTTVAHPSCLYRGHDDTRSLYIALSTCDDNMTATLLRDNIPHNIEFVRRVRRDTAEMSEADRDDDTHQMVVTVTPDQQHQHRCGLSQRNLKKMMVAEQPVIKLPRVKRRSKRSASERVIEIAVFVDPQMYEANKQSTDAATTEKIQDLVFTYLNAVQLLYQSTLLTNKLRLVLVRLDIMSTSPSDLSDGQGDIETYLENFCR